MKERRRQRLLIESPSSATGDIAFNLIVFFLVCASVQPDSGRKQTLPRSEETEKQKEAENIEVQLTRTTNVVTFNGDPIPIQEFPVRLKRVLDSKTRDEDKVVVVKSKPDTPYDHWIYVTGLIEQAGGIITIQTEEEREVRVP